MEAVWSNTFLYVCMHGKGRGCRGGGFARSDGAFAGGGRLPEFSRLPIDAGPAALFHSFPVGGRRRIPEARGIAAYRAIPRTHGCAPRSAARCDQGRDDRVNYCSVTVTLTE